MKQQDSTTSNHEWGYNEARTPTQKGSTFVYTKDNIQDHRYVDVAKQIRAKLTASSHLMTSEIRLKDVGYVATVPIEDSHIETLASAFKLPTFGTGKSQTKYILKNINAILKPGSMTLVLGPPGCGKTSLLKHIAGILHVKGKERVDGSITYNGCNPDQVDLSSLIAYVQQCDNHFPTLTVKETLDFSHKCLVGRVNPNDPLAENEKHMVDILIATLGLTECADTIIGDEMTRGVSGGQKRRVTVGEMMTGHATTLLLDEFSNGLDASTTFDIAKSIRTMAEILEKTVVMSMLQPPPEVYDLFDNIIVLDEGEMMYNGPRQQLPAYFRSIGYECPPRKDIADFLQEVTTSLGQRYATVDPAKSLNRPTTASEFAEAFKKSSIYRTLHDNLTQLPTHHWSKVTKPTSKYALGLLDGYKVVIGRAWKTSVRDMNFNISRLGEAIVLGAVIGTVFLNIGRDKSLEEEVKNAPIKFSLFFTAILTQAMATLAAIDEIIKRRDVLYKQSAFNFFLPSTYAFCEAAMDFFWTIFQVFLFSIPTYFAVGLHNSAESFFIFVGLLYLVSISYSQFFKFFTAMSPDGMIANVIVMFAFFLHIVFSGYILPEAKIPTAWSWVYWTNPLAWTLRALIQNEFLSSTPNYDTLTPIIFSNGTTSTIRFGDNVVLAYGMSTNKDYIWSAAAFLSGFFLLMVALTSLAYQYVRMRKPFANTLQEKLNTTSDDSTALEVIQDGRGINSLSFEPITLSFSHLFYTINVGTGKNKTTRQLLKDVHGFFQPGTLTALMGSTGAGKTTLMDVIAGRKTAGKIDGELYVNGHPLDRRTFNTVMGYCEQTDTHESTSTVRETFKFSAALRLPVDTTKEMRFGFVSDILEVLELSAKADTQYLALTQGERKRVTIGVELLSNPSILFLDEPTTGLDSRAATVVMECIKRIAQSGRTVVCTIHQPSTVLFELFDKLVLLKTGGELVFFGDLGQESANLLSYFGQFEGLSPMGDRENPATYMLNCIGAGTENSKIDVDFAAAYTKSWLGVENHETIQQLSQENGSKLETSNLARVGFAQQFAILFGRQWATYWRTPSYNTSRAILMVVVPLIFGSCFYKMKVETTMDIVSQMALIFMSTSFLCIAIMTTAIPFASQSRSVFYREHMSAIFNNTADACVWFWASVFTNMALWSYLGHLLVYCTETMQLAVLTGSSVSGILFIFSGFLIDGNTLSKGWQWMYWISPMHYMLESIIMAQYNSQKKMVFDAITSSPIAINSFVQRFFNGAYSYDHLGRDMAIMWGMIVIMQVIIFFFMAKVNHIAR